MRSATGYEIKECEDGDEDMVGYCSGDGRPVTATDEWGGTPVKLTTAAKREIYSDAVGLEKKPKPLRTRLPDELAPGGGVIQ